MPYDHGRLLITTGGNEDLARELISIFLDSYEEMIDSLSLAMQRGRAEELRSAAHKLKGSLSSLGAGTTLEQAAALEEMGSEENLEQAETAFNQLKIDMDALVTELRTTGGVPAL